VRGHELVDVLYLGAADGAATPEQIRAAAEWLTERAVAIGRVMPKQRNAYFIRAVASLVGEEPARVAAILRARALAEGRRA